MARTNAVEVLEACYRLELDENAWLEGIAESCAAALGSPLGALIYVFDGRHQQLRFSRNFSPDWVSVFTRRFVERLVPEAERGGDPLALTLKPLAPILSGRSTAVSAVPALAPLLPLLQELGGARDLLTLNGYDSQGQGMSLGIPLPQRMRTSRAGQRMFSRLTTHLAAAYRLRRRLHAGERPDAVLDPGGALVEADNREASEARAELRRGAILLDRARSRSVRRDPERATALWTGLVSARWSLIDDFSVSGTRFVVARRNDLPVDARPETLTQRERQVLACAAAGRSNKEIAYELGLADSTVRVLLLRAADKLGVRGRDAALARYRVLVGKS